MKGIIILGSSRSDGDTAAVVNQLAQLLSFDVLDLNTINFSDYDYAANNQGDDFLPSIRRIAEHHQHIVWATPIYWYTMSATMKRFMDRLTDCLRTEKSTGRKLRGKHMSLLSVSNDVRNQGFEHVFQLTAEYLGMAYAGDVHVCVEDVQQDFTQQLKPLINDIEKC